jgi:hypothetical protein
MECFFSNNSAGAAYDCPQPSEAGCSGLATKENLSMKRALILFLSLSVMNSLAQNANQETKPSSRNDVVHVNTAFEHLTVLEFGEPVSMAAVGSSAFRIERQENKLFIKPLKHGVSTDLFVWTRSRRFTYELEPPGEVTNMNFAIDTLAPVPREVPDAHEQVAKIADMMLTKAFLGAKRIDSSNIKDSSNGITVRVEQTFESSNTLYVQYSILNRTRRAYRVLSPSVYQVLASAPTIAVPALANTQLNNGMLHRLRDARRVALHVANAEVQNQDLAPGDETRGVIAIRHEFDGTTLLELLFPAAEDHNVTATFAR